MQKRLKQVLLYTAIALCAGLAYAWLVSKIGFGIPCIFHTVTGLDCPSCGVSRMCIALLQLRFADAFGYNPAMFCLLPLFLSVGIGWIIGYVRHGRTELQRWMYAAVIFMICVLILFGIARNLV